MINFSAPQYSRKTDFACFHSCSTCQETGQSVFRDKSQGLELVNPEPQIESDSHLVLNSGEFGLRRVYFEEEIMALRGRHY